MNSPESVYISPYLNNFNRGYGFSRGPDNAAGAPGAPGAPGGPPPAYTNPTTSLTLELSNVYNKCNNLYSYKPCNNPRRVLTKPSKPMHNQGYDNQDNDYILYVNDWLGGGGNNNYLIIDILGQGTFGQVAKCQNVHTGQIVAIKVIKNKPAYFNQSMMEVTILELLNNQFDNDDNHHILRLLDQFIHCKHLCLVFELLSSNLYELIKQNSFRGLSTSLVKVFTSQLLDALVILNQARLIHCDLKPENILLKSLQSPQIKIIDFGSACHERQTVYTYIQSRFYRSPEVLLGMPYSSAIDIWSLGCIAVELFLGLPLFPGTSEYNQISRIVDMLGLPPAFMLQSGKQVGEFFEQYVDDFGNTHYKLKSMEKYSQEHNTQEQPSKKYFSASTLPEIIKQYPIPSSKARSDSDLKKEHANRLSFIHFVQGLLNMNPIEVSLRSVRDRLFDLQRVCSAGHLNKRDCTPSSQASNSQAAGLLLVCPQETSQAHPQARLCTRAVIQCRQVRRRSTALLYQQHRRPWRRLACQLHRRQPSKLDLMADCRRPSPRSARRTSLLKRTTSSWRSRAITSVSRLRRRLPTPMHTEIRSLHHHPRRRRRRLTRLSRHYRPVHQRTRRRLDTKSRMFILVGVLLLR